MRTGEALAARISPAIEVQPSPPWYGGSPLPPLLAARDVRVRARS